MKQLREEIDLVLGGERTVTKAHIQNMRHLKNVITESMQPIDAAGGRVRLRLTHSTALRLYPSVPLNVRTANHPTILPNGGGPDGLSPVLVRKSMGVGFSPYHMHRRKDLYGDDAHDFRPERWEDGSLHEKIGWGYLPFNGGPRICLGRRLKLWLCGGNANHCFTEEFALLEASYAVIRIVQSFPKLALPSDEKLEPVGSEKQTLTLTVSPAEGCRVCLR